MKLLLFFVAILPCLWGAEVKSVKCPDGKECPFEKTCCATSSGVFECCDLPEDDKLNKKLILGFSSSSSSNMSYAPNGMQAGIFDCPGTWCGYPQCCPNYINAECCKFGDYCCPSNSKCCGAPGMGWCCGAKTRCATYGYCIAGAASLSSAILSVFFMFLVVKYFL